MKHKEFFYSPPENILANFVEITGDELNHLIRVVRKKERDIIDVVDGIGNQYTVLLTEIKSFRAKGEIQKRTRFAGEPQIKLSLALAIPKSRRFDLAIEKGTEIGVSVFVPLICENSVIEDSQARISRWKKIAIAAMKQCGRSVLPAIMPAQTFKQVLEAKSLLTTAFIAHQDKDSKNLNRLLQVLKSREQIIKSALILIGPEAGFSPEEVKLAHEYQCLFFSLGPRRLRSETAGIIASAIFLEMMEV